MKKGPEILAPDPKATPLTHRFLIHRFNGYTEVTMPYITEKERDALLRLMFNDLRINPKAPRAGETQKECEADAGFGAVNASRTERVCEPCDGRISYAQLLESLL